MDVALKAAEQQNDRELTSKFSARMQASVRDIGRVDSMRHTILSYVAAEQYQKAIEELKKYIDSKHEYPQFKTRTARYFGYAVDLVNAVKAKRSFPGLQQLAMSKQQELFDRAMAHFEDLKVTLKKVEQIEREVRLEDIRSTVWVVKALVLSIFALFVLGFLIEMSRGVLPTAWALIDSTFGDLTNFVFDKIGF